MFSDRMQCDGALREKVEFGAGEAGVFRGGMKGRVSTVCDCNPSATGGWYADGSRLSRSCLEFYI